MPAVTRSHDPGGESPVVAIVTTVLFVLFVVSLAWVSQRFSSLSVTRQTNSHGANIAGATANGRGMRREPLQEMPVVIYNESLCAAHTPSYDAGSRAAIAPGTRPWPVTRLLAALRWNPNSSIKHQPTTGCKPSPENVFVEDNLKSCAVCTENFIHGTFVRQLPCGHLFHPLCIDPWLLDFATTCPLCRVDLRAPAKVHLKAESARES
ncbi:hypothetical protein QBC46DRAFT_420171 [Diplogelasinospora grovesii]|uniref:RING-type domain-containing protein n=1 Tax=Diplogelasinospora grovesii TaxID=303347 RepID=A0AAN6S0Q5_9PEZI|nr:hypothetical protein QBC46DRAFT_420171 [Diplogelasinospora grovesii]